MKQTGLTVGKKIFGVFGAMSALIVTLVCIYVLSYRESARLLNTVLHVYIRKQTIGAEVELATTEMQGAQRGVTLAYAMKDPAAAAQYVKLFADSMSTIDTLLAESRPLLTTDTERSSVDEIVENRRAWGPRFDDLKRLCESGDIAAAYELRNSNKILSAKMHTAATALVAEQKKTIDAVQASSIATSNWIAACAILFSVALGSIGVTVVRRITLQLRHSIIDLHEGADQVSSAAGQISASSQSLAQGASEQAASLQETAASSEEMSSVTRRNAGNSQQAAKLMHNVDERVAEANRTLADMMASMREIGASSAKISKIIQVIDEIAFQTNILSLNAAVEAARAGEAGMGFAVVADEVRNLAQRSAQAAKDTAEIVEESIRRSQDGSVKLSGVAASIEAITEGAAKVRILVDEVESSSREQAQGIGQISRAVSRMEEVTQKTAASAQESASASEELNAQGKSLMTVVGRLQTMVGAGSGHSPNDRSGESREF
jgi:methyl-accepting chemotaxis protein/methyl-accepting chemotaxis protein-1 (serine sensor receptor)